MSGKFTIESNQDIEWAIGLNRMCLSVVGLWPKIEKSLWKTFRSNLHVAFVAAVVFNFAVLPQTMALAKTWGNLTLMVENLIINLPMITGEFKLFIMWFNKKDLVVMLEYFMYDWKKSKTDRQREVMIKYARIARIISYGALVNTVFEVILFDAPILFGISLRTLTNLTDGTRPYLLHSIFFYDTSTSPRYEITILGQMMSVAMAGHCFASVDAVFGVFVLHICGQLENLNYDICNFVDANSKTFQNMVQICVDNHLQLIRFVKYIEGIFSLVMFEMFLTFSIVFCSQSFQLIILMKDDALPPVQLIFGIIYITNWCFLMLIYCCIGEMLVMQSESIHYAAYECPWYLLHPTESSQLMMVSIRAQNPLQITAGKILPLTLNTFAQLLKTSASYISVLLAVKV